MPEHLACTTKMIANYTYLTF